ncbi:hypothetical protein R1sor_002519 [Riccia sorocarpa]|uniref:Probable alanine--tRNA ligase, chloroplastic n=1 Tax=Riccia sorocarpa TaxID=122646 RepID=A0ABD3GZ21_9MARC
MSPGVGFLRASSTVLQSFSGLNPSTLHFRGRIGRPGLSVLRSSPTFLLVVRCGSSSSALKEQLTEQSAAAMTIDPENRGDNIRKRFLSYYESRGHKILPSSSLVPEDPTVLLTIAGMLQFKPIFLGQIPRTVPRATTSQKCVRTNDIENVGVTARHHTFFEMLGNFSFGDYFKKEAIRFAWELATKEFKLPAERVFVSVFEEDDEAYAIWRDEIGVPVERIKRMGAEDNFWASGPTGPCGPCSEMYYDFHPERGLEDTDLNDDSRFIEFYNLVFMQSNRLDDGSLIPLQNKNIDTGLGLERLAQILQKVPNNYETDLIFPIINFAAELANIDYRTADERTKTHLKVIGDHTRAVTYLISDGVNPSNVGRGYIVRRLIRRIVRMGRLLGIKGDGKGNPEGTFLPRIAEVAVNLSPPADPNVKLNAARIYEELDREEARFVQTLERGEKLLEKLLTDALSRKNGIEQPRLAGKDIFLLYDTFGFPVEITEEVARERGVGVDLEGFETEMEVQRTQSQAAAHVVKLTVGGAAAELTNKLSKSKFLGYHSTEGKGEVVALLSKGVPLTEASEGEVELILDETPFYAESGGQIGDHGVIEGRSEDGSPFVVRVLDVQKAGQGLILHRGQIEQGKITLGAKVSGVVDVQKRRRAMAHHTATHLLQSALKKVLGDSVSQAGSLVAFDRLRFDFNLPRAMTEEEVQKTEDLVNGWIGQAVDLDTKVMALADAKKSGAIAMFGEKYDEEVRVVNVEGISKELCGGTHVRNTSDIRGIKIISEQGIAAGVRRIEAVCGAAFIEYVNQRDSVVKQLNSLLKVKPEDLASRVQSLQEELRSMNKEAAALRAELAIAKAETFANNAEIVGPGNTRVLVTSLGTVDSDALRVAAEHLVTKMGDPSAFVIASNSGDGKVNLVVAFSKSVVKQGLAAGKFVGPIAKLCGGGGGGKPNFAQAGGKLPEKLEEALKKAKVDLVEALSKAS